MSNGRARFWRRNWPAAVVVLLVSGYLATEVALSIRATPPARVSDFGSFLEWRPSTSHFGIMVDADGREHLIAYGPRDGLLPSGPSAYVFSRDGALLDRSRDIGDDSGFRRRWPKLRETLDLTREDAVAWLNSQAADG